MSTQLSLPSVDALRQQFASSTPEPQAPSAPVTPSQGFRRGSSAAEAAEPTRPAVKRLVNKFEADCSVCGRRVAVGEGLLSKPGKLWITRHFPECPPAPEAEPEVEVKEGDLPVAIDPRNPYPGIYTVEDEEGHVTLRVWQQPQNPEDGFAPGALLVEYLIGRDNEADYKRFAFVKGGRLQVWNHHKAPEGQPEKRYVRAARVLLDNPAAVLTAKNCPRCNAVLSNPVSIAAGIGPDCRKIWGW